MEQQLVEHISHEDKLLAIILRTQFCEPGINFFTPDDFSQQLAHMSRPANYVIAPHVHNSVPRNVQFTKEVLFIKSGKLRVDFYDDNKTYLESRILNKGDVVLLAFGGHGFQMIEDTEILEVKQGPYAGDVDKTRFEPISAGQVVWDRVGHDSPEGTKHE